MRISILFVCIFLFKPYTFCNESDSLLLQKVKFESFILLDNVSNFSGGLENGSTLLALFSLNADIQPFRTGVFRNTGLFVHLLKTGSQSASEKFIGDIQVASNIEGLSSRFLYELFIRQKLGNFTISAGLHDLNTEFITSEYASDYLNSSFGIFPVISLNFPGSIYPITTFGSFVNYNRQKVGISAGIYNVSHEYPEESSFDFNNHFYQRGYLGIGEFQYRWNYRNLLNGEIKIGAYMKNCTQKENEHSHGSCLNENNYGYYLISDQLLHKSLCNYSIGSFVQIGISPMATNLAKEYYGIGISARNDCIKSKLKQFGLAIARVRLNSFLTDNISPYETYETSIEFTAKIQFMRRVVIQPDIQYIINPSGMYKDAFVGIIRLKLELF